MLTNTKIVSSALVLVTASFGTVATAQAGVDSVPFDNPNGLADTYAFTDGSSSTGLFNDPIVSGDALLFTPDNFIALSDESSDSITETVCLTLTANEGLQFSDLTFAMAGDFAILGESVATAGAVLTVENLDTNVTLSTDPDSDVFFNGDGLFELGDSIELPDGWSNVLVKITGDLFAESDGQGSAAIQFKSVGLNAGTEAIVPIPAAAFAAPLLLIGGLKARKRFAKKR
ncbi:MAG: hypothetical protein AAGD32_01490 [Planctomycetota bacterium]